MNLTPASSSDLPSAAILTRVSESGTRLMHTAILIRGDATTPRCTLQVVNHDSARGKQTCGFSSGNLRMTSRRSDVKRLEIRTDAHEQMPQHARRDEPLHGIARNGRVLGERAERDVATVEHVRDRDADVVAAHARLERRVHHGVIREPSLHVFLVTAQVLRADVANVESRAQMLRAEGQW